LAIVFVWNASAFAAVPRLVQLDYERQEGAAGCPDEVAIRAGVAARLGYEPFRAQADERLRATIRQIGRALEARIELSDAEGNLKAQRRLTSRNHNCVELAASVELAIAIAIDAVIQAPPQSSLVPAESTASPSAPPPGHSTIPIRVEASMQGGVGSAPAAHLGLRAGVALQGEAASLGVEVRADLPASASLKVGHATSSLVVASLVPCGHASMLSACLLVTAGAQRVAGGDGLLNPRHATLSYLGFGVRLGLALPITARISLALHGDVTAPVTETKLQVDNTVVWTSPAVAMTLGLGLAFRFP
jgi:hypothetical protein